MRRDRFQREGGTVVTWDSGIYHRAVKLQSLPVQDSSGSGFLTHISRQTSGIGERAKLSGSCGDLRLPLKVAGLSHGRARSRDPASVIGVVVLL